MYSVSHLGNSSQVKKFNCSAPGQQILRPNFGNKLDQLDLSDKTPATLGGKASFDKITQLITLIINKLSAIFCNNNNESQPKAEPVDIKDTTRRLKKATQVMKDFAHILDEDQQRATPVFKTIKSGTLERMFNLALRKDNTPVLIGVTGGSASGKTTIKDNFVDAVKASTPESPDGKPFIQDISQDNFYYDFSDEIKKKGADEVFKNKNLDHPDAVELSLLTKKLEELKAGKEVKIPEFLVNGTGVRVDDKITVKPAPIIAVEGLFTLTDKTLSNMFDLKVFIDASKEVREKRWWARAEKRNLKHDEAGEAFFNRTFTMHDKFVEPHKADADLVINSEADRRSVKKVLTQLGEALTKPVSFTGLINSFKKAA